MLLLGLVWLEARACQNSPGALFALRRNGNSEKKGASVNRALFASISGLVAAGTPSANTLLSDYGQLGAVAMLGIITIILVTRTIPRMSESFAKAQREIAKQAHADSEKLNQTLTELRIHCAKKQE